MCGSYDKYEIGILSWNFDDKNDPRRLETLEICSDVCNWEGLPLIQIDSHGPLVISEYVNILQQNSLMVVFDKVSLKVDFYLCYLLQSITNM